MEERGVPRQEATSRGFARSSRTNLSKSGADDCDWRTSMTQLVEIHGASEDGSDDCAPRLIGQRACRPRVHGPSFARLGPDVFTTFDAQAEGAPLALAEAKAACLRTTRQGRRDSRFVIVYDRLQPEAAPQDRNAIPRVPAPDVWYLSRRY